MPPSIPPNAYTDALEQHPNLILGSLQLLFWLLFHPAAWRNHIARIDPTLRPDFWVAELSKAQWQNPALRRLLVQVYLVLPLLLSLLIGLGLWGARQPGEDIAIGVAFVVAIGIAFGVAGSVAGNVAFGVAGSVAFGVAGSIVNREESSIVNQEETYSLTKQAGSNIVAILLGGMVGGVAFGVTFSVASGVVIGVMSSVFFALPYAIAERVAGSWAGAIAGAVSCSGVWLSAIASDPNASQGYTWLGGVIGLVGGLTLSWWRPVLFYPFTAVLNTLLYRLDEQRTNRPFSFLRYHSAFWDEHQRLPLLGLDSHVVLVAERYPAEGQAAVEYLSTSRQRWAAQAAQIELDARQLERCANTTAIGQIQQSLSVGELEGPASALFRSFHRISEDVSAALTQNSVYNRRLALTAVADRLDSLLRELTRSSDKYAVRFRPIVQRWINIIALELAELIKAAELRQEIESPYIIGVPLTERQAMFVGRTDISSRIEQLLLDRRHPPLLLYGQRRTGKTSLLNNLGRLLPNRIIPMFVDLQGPASRASDHAGFLYNIARGMIDSAKKQRDLTLPALPREALTDDPFTRFDEWLDQVEATLQDKTALLALDEFEVLDQVLVAGRFSETAVLGMFRNLIQHRLHFKVLLSGSHTLEEFQRWSSYLINAQVLHLGYLKAAEARQLIERPIEGFTLRYDPDASQRVLDLTRAHPFLVQLLCAEIVASKNEQDPSVRRLATLADVETASSQALSSGSMFFSDIEGNQIDAKALAVLQYLAAKGEGATIDPPTLLVQFPDSWEAAIDLLLKRELIERTPSGYRFQVELIRRWFVQG
jgi:hypothetical protein